MVASIVQVLLIKDAEAYGDLSPVLWTALEEVAAFFSTDASLAEFRRAYLSVEPPPSEMADGVGENWIQSPEGFWEEAQGTFTGTYDAARLCDGARRLLEADPSEANLLIVTDREITPPPDLRYIVWGGCAHGGGVVSVAPTDPQYWGESHRKGQRSRAAIIKHRVRTASLAVVGTMLGLDRCENERCFMFANVDSVTRLDHMVSLGPEHGLPQLTGRGYQALTANPAEVQSIIDDPPPEYALA